MWSCDAFLIGMLLDPDIGVSKPPSLYACAHIRTYIHACMHASMHTYIHTDIHTHVHGDLHPSIHPSTHPSIHPCIPTYTHTYKHTCIHTYMAQALSGSNRQPLAAPSGQHPSALCPAEGNGSARVHLDGEVQEVTSRERPTGAMLRAMAGGNVFSPLNLSSKKPHTAGCCCCCCCCCTVRNVVCLQATYP